MQNKLLLGFLVLAVSAAAQTVRLVPGQVPVAGPVDASALVAPTVEVPRGAVAATPEPAPRASSSALVRRPGAPSSSLSRADLELLFRVFLAQHPELKWTAGWVAGEAGMDPVAGKGTLVLFEDVDVAGLRAGDLVVLRAPNGSYLLQRFVQAEDGRLIVRPDHGGRTDTVPGSQLAGRALVHAFCNPSVEGNTDAFMAALAQY